jgi:hypothetical protein
MKKLMLTTAIASVITSAAIAQTSITGELRLSYKDVTAPRGLANTGTVGGSTNNTAYGFGAEQQINIQNKGKLNLGGLDYAAGFSIENDGEQTGTLFNENVYMDLTNASSGTTISFGRDHIQRSDSDFSATNLVGFTPNEMSQLTNATNGGTRFAQNIGPATSQAFGAAIVQKSPFGTFSYNYVPNNAAPSAGTISSTGQGQAASTTLTTVVGTGVPVVNASLVGNAASEAVNDNTTAAYEYGFVGDLGVKGLTAHYFKSANQDFANTWTQGATKAEAKNYGAKYNFGDFTVGANKKVYNPEAATVIETTEVAYAAAIAINKELTVGALYGKAEQAGGAGVVGAGVEQKIKAINVGYNLGPVALAAGYAKTTDAQGQAGADNDVFMIRLLGAF